MRVRGACSKMSDFRTDADAEKIFEKSRLWFDKDSINNYNVVEGSAKE